MDGFAGTASLQVVDRMSHLDISLASKLVDAITAVKGATDLFVSLNKTLELNSQISVLINENAAVVLKSIDFCLNICVLSLEALVGVTEILLLGLCAV